jgi:hypothetical protein
VFHVKLLDTALIVRIFPDTLVVVPPAPRISKIFAIALPLPEFPWKIKGTSGGKIAPVTLAIPD